MAVLYVGRDFRSGYRNQFKSNQILLDSYQALPRCRQMALTDNLQHL